MLINILPIFLRIIRNFLSQLAVSHSEIKSASKIMHLGMSLIIFCCPWLLCAGWEKPLCSIEGDLLSSLEASRNYCGLMRMQVHSVVHQMKILGLNYSSECWEQVSRALILLLTGCGAVCQPNNSLFQCGKWGHLSLLLWWGSLSSHEPSGNDIRSSL